MGKKNEYPKRKKESQESDVTQKSTEESILGMKVRSTVLMLLRTQVRETLKNAHWN